VSDTALFASGPAIAAANHSLGACSACPDASSDARMGNLERRRCDRQSVAARTISLQTDLSGCPWVQARLGLRASD
jgi:hypothetical protein